MEKKVYKADTVIFRQGDAGCRMYDILEGSVGIYMNYGKPEQKLLATLREGAYFGEMALIDETTRSATAVVLESGTQLAEISPKDFASYFESRPATVLGIMQQLSRRIRDLTRDYLGACKTVTEAAKDMENGHSYAPELAERIRFYAQQAAE